MYAFIDSNRGRWPVDKMARAMKISLRSYYAYKAGIPSKREQKRDYLERRIQEVYAAAKGRWLRPLRESGSISSHFQLCDSK